MFGKIDAIKGISPDNDYKKLEQQPPQQVAFINTIFEGFGNSSGTEASFNA